MSAFQVNTEISLEEGQAMYQDAMQRAMASLTSKGVGAPSPPTTIGQGGVVVHYRGELPADLTSLNDNQLGTYMGLLAEWDNYISFQLAEADTNLTAAKAELGLVEAKLRLLYQKDGGDNGKKRSNPERDDYVGSDRRYIEIQQRMLYWHAMYTFLRTIHNNADNSYGAVSRRVTQRGQEVDRMNRGTNVGQGTNLPAGPLFPTNTGPRRM